MGWFHPRIRKKYSDRKDKVVVGMVGLINRAKGCIEFVEAANLCEQRNLNRI